MARVYGPRGERGEWKWNGAGHSLASDRAPPKHTQLVGVRASRGWKEVLFFGPLRARPEHFGQRIAVLPARMLLVVVAVTLGVLIGVLWASGR